jgi:Aspartyl protease
MAQEKSIPVILGPPITGGFARRPPLVRVLLAFDETWTPTKGEWPSNNSKSYLALLDTGADFCAVDPVVADEIGAHVEENGDVKIFGGPRKIPGRAVVQVILPTANEVYETRFAIMDFRGAGQPWDVILGRNFLRHCYLIVDGPGGRYDLEWVGAYPLPTKSE